MKNKLHISEKIENLRENLRISKQILGSLKKKTIDINFYVDSNHLKISIDSITEKLHRFSLQLCKYYQLENLKNFNLNQESYGRFTAEIFFKFLNKYQEVLVDKNSTFFPRKGSLKKLKAYGPFLTEQVFHDIIFKMDKKLSKNEVYEIFEEVYSQPIKKAIYVKFNCYLKFFIGDKPDIPKIRRMLYYKKISDKEALDLISAREKQQESYTEFKKAINNLNLHWFNSTDMVHQIEYGITKPKVLFKPKLILKLDEKMVDTKIVMASLDDFQISEKDTSFVFLTNDTDFQPLFERIKSRYSLFWMCGDEKKYHSKELKEVVNSNYIFSFGDQIEHIDPSSIFKDLKFPANYSSLLGDYIYQIMPKSWPDWMD